MPQNENNNEGLIFILTQKKSQIRSYIYMFLSSLFWVGGYVYGNQHKFSPFQTNLSRSIIMMIGIYIICRAMNLNIQYQSPQDWRILTKRHFAFTIQGFVLAGVQFVLPLGVVHTIASSGPIFTLILQKIMYKKTAIQGMKLLGCITAVIGLILTSNGKQIYSMINQQFEFQTHFNNYVSNSPIVVILATILIILCMIIWAYGVIITQSASCHSFEIIFHFAVTNMIISSISYMFLTEKRPASEIYQSLLWTGLSLFLAEIFFTLSLKISEYIGMTIITSFGTTIVGYSIGIFRYGQTVDIISISGTILVLIGVSSVILSKQKKIQQQK